MEIKDRRARMFPGNYEAYLRQNSVSTVTQVSSYEDGLKALERLQKQILTARSRKAGASNNRPKLLEERLQREYDRIKRDLDKPSIWIDQESVDLLHDDVVEKYERYKDRNIQIQHAKLQEHGQMLLRVKSLSVGYEKPLFGGVSFQLAHGDRLRISGRNGAGKSTLIRTLLAAIAGTEPAARVFHGEMLPGRNLRVGVYEQEISARHLDETLERAVIRMHLERNLPVDDQAVRRLLSMYLFDPREDLKLRLEQLSGGQKARMQMMRMFLSKPNVLVLDEPTNHLDLPSIEEMEKTLAAYAGAIIYVSHDSYFVKKLAGTELRIP